MHNLLKITIISILSLFILTSCGEDEVNDQIQASIENQAFRKAHSTPTPETLSKNKDFRNLVDLTYDLLKKEKDIQTLISITEQETLSDDNDEKLIIALGFNSREEFDRVNNRIFSHNEALSEEFDVSSLSPEEISELIISATALYLPNTLMKNSCAQEESGCIAGVTGQYLQDLAACTGGSLWASGFTGPLGGLVIGVGCWAGVSLKASVGKENCKAERVRCEKQQ